MKARSAIVSVLCCASVCLAAAISAFDAHDVRPGISRSRPDLSSRDLSRPDLSRLNLSRRDLSRRDLKVIFFLDPECPVSNAYMREIRSIYEEYSKKGVAFEAIFPVATVKREDIKSFLTKYKTAIPGYRDPELMKVKRYQATTMPEAVLIESGGGILYRGAIDNWYYALGKNRAKATELYLRNALEASLNGEIVVTGRTQAIGCLINL